MSYYFTSFFANKRRCAINLQKSGIAIGVSAVASYEDGKIAKVGASFLKTI